MNKNSKIKTLELFDCCYRGYQQLRQNDEEIVINLYFNYNNDLQEVLDDEYFLNIDKSEYLIYDVEINLYEDNIRIIPSSPYLFSEGIEKITNNKIKILIKQN